MRSAGEGVRRHETEQGETADECDPKAHDLKQAPAEVRASEWAFRYRPSLAAGRSHSTVALSFSFASRSRAEVLSGTS
jgi:hypothetical protein